MAERRRCLVGRRGRAGGWAGGRLNGEVRRAALCSYPAAFATTVCRLLAGRTARQLDDWRSLRECEKEENPLQSDVAIITVIKTLTTIQFQ